MAWDELEATLQVVLLRGAFAVGAVAIVLLAPALLAHLLERAERAPRLRSRLERMAPTPARAVAGGIVAMIVALGGPRAHGADEPRGRLLHAAEEPPAREPRPGEVVPVLPTPTTTRAASPPSVPTSAPPAPAPAPPAAPAPSPPSSPSSPPPPAVATHEVRRGECLWSIAAARLGAAATAADIDREWRSIYAANRAAVGDDPNLIRPGLRLLLPPLSTP